jgi:type VI secretion system secreted protein Hcp
VAIYLKYDGVEGNVTTKGFEKQIELITASYGSGRSIGMSARTDVNRGHAEPHLSEISIAKMWDDMASVKLFEDAIAGVGNKNATLSFTTTSKNTVMAFLVLDLENVVVSNYSIGGGGESQPNETLALNYTKITVTPYEVKDGKATKKSVVTYSLPTMQANG